MKKYWNYYTDDTKKKMAFCMPYENDYDLRFKIVIRVRGKKGTFITMLVKRRFCSRDLAQERLDQIAASQGWKKAFS